MAERNNELRQAWDFVEHTGRSIFLTGKAGTGKTTFLKTVVERSTKRSIVVAPTGVAAINAGGVTIHSFFQLPFAPFVPNAHIKSKFDFGKEKRKIIASLDLLIIDEISMVRSDLLDAIDSVLRRYRDRYQPFGGVQLLMIGDLQQLTPVVTAEDEKMLAPYYDTPYFFGSKALAQLDYVTIQLEKVYRQQDDTFITLLNHIREGHPTADDIDLLNSHCNPTFMPRPEDGYIRLTTHNNLANHYNESELRKLTGMPFYYKATVEGSFPEISYPTNETLELKVGAQVMFVKNDPTGNQRYFNGRIGRVTYLEREKVCVHCQGDAKPIEVEPLVWENARYTLNPVTREIQTDVQGTFRQFPLRLAWAITIHKSQGLTFEHAIIDASLSFAPGQVYVALSRCKTLEGMMLATRISQQAIINDQRVDDYIAHQEEAASLSISQLPTLKEEYYRFLLLELFDFRPLLYQEEHLGRLLLEFFYNSHTSVAELHKRTLDDLRQQVIGVADKWRHQIGNMTIEQLHAADFLERVKRSARYFHDTLTRLLARPLELTKPVESKNKQAMRRLAEAYADLSQTFKARTQLLNHMADETFTTTAYLNTKQDAMLDAMDDGQSRQKRERKKRESTPRAPKEQQAKEEETGPKEKTHEVSFRMYQKGMRPEQIAAERKLAMSTIYSHLSRYVGAGQIPLTDIIDEHRYQTILKVLYRVGRDESITAVKSLCPPDVSYEEIRMVQESLK